MTDDQRVKCIENIYQILKEVVDLEFPVYGNIYFANTLTYPTHVLDDEFCIGPHCGDRYWGCGTTKFYHHHGSPTREPCTSKPVCKEARKEKREEKTNPNRARPTRIQQRANRHRPRTPPTNKSRPGLIPPTILPRQHNPTYKTPPMRPKSPPRNIHRPTTTNPIYTNAFPRYTKTQHPRLGVRSIHRNSYPGVEASRHRACILVRESGA